jgi:hypothetical protein
LCALEAAYEATQNNCGTGSGAAGFCDGIAQCIAELADCFEPACPTGSTATAAASSCVMTYTSCITGALGMGGQQ